MAIKPFNSVAGFSVGEIPANVILANGDIITGNVQANANITANGNITANFFLGNGAYLTGIDATSIQNGNSNVKVYANANIAISSAGISNVVIVTGTELVVAGTFSASGNATAGNLSTVGNISSGNLIATGLLSVIGNANVGNIGAYNGTFTTITGTLTTNAQPNITSVGALVDLSIIGNANIGNIGSAGVITAIGNIGAGNISTTGLLTVAGNANIGNIGTGGFITATGNITGSNLFTAGNSISSNATVNLQLSGNTANFTGNVTAPNFIGNVIGNISGNITIPGVNTGVVFNDNGTANSSAGFTFNNTSNAIVANGNLTVNNANLGNLAIANFFNVSGNTLTNNLTVNLELSGNTANFTGNITAANIVGALANGTSNVKVYSNANVEITIGGTANVATFSSAGLFVAGDVNSTTGNITSNGSVTANGVLNGANANVTGQAILGSVLTSNITAPSGNITISAAGTNQSIYLIPTGTGTLDVALKRVTEVGEPTQPTDATTKQYVDNIAQGLSIHVPVRVTSTTNLNAIYNNGGTALTTTTITGGKTITFSANHGLVAGDEIYWTSSFNGIIANDAYFVYSAPALDQITVKAGFYGIEVTTLANATGLTQPSLGNPGVGATLTNAGANAAISIDGVALSSTNRVLVQGQTNGFENGVYTVTTVGNGSTAWVFTRATTEDQYDPKSTTGLGYGDYFFVQEGNTAAGSAYVLTSPTGEILFGITNIGFSQFSAAGTYSAGNGIAITGTIISANVDLVTTSIVGGNITVKTSANLTTPNIGDATFSSITWNTLSNGNVTANNLSISNVANIGSNLTIGGSIQSNGNISSNANINGNNAFFTNLLDVGGNLLANNITSNNAFSTNTANISSNLVTSNATVNLELSGNTANFTGNIVALNTNAGNLLTANFANIASNTTTSNLTVNLQLDGNTANFSGNITSLNANLGNLATANFINVSSNLNVTDTANVGNLRTNNLLYANGQPWDLQEAAGSNRQIQFNDGNNNFAANANLIYDYVTSNLTIVGNVIATTFVGNISGNISGNIVIPGSNTGVVFNDNGNANTSTAFTFNKVSNVVALAGNLTLANTTIATGTTTTSNVNANQTIVQFSTTGIAAMEFLVKGIDSTGSKYSVSTVTAVTNGTNVDYVTYATAFLNSTTGSLAVNVVGGNVALQVTPASSNSTVWTTQVRFI